MILHVNEGNMEEWNDVSGHVREELNLTDHEDRRLAEPPSLNPIDNLWRIFKLPVQPCKFGELKMRGMGSELNHNAAKKQMTSYR